MTPLDQHPTYPRPGRRPAAANAVRTPLPSRIGAVVVACLFLPAAFLAVSGSFRLPIAQPSETAGQEQRRLQGFMGVLHSEGMVHTMAPCRGGEVCVEVAEGFRGLQASDQRNIGRGIQRYFEILGDAPQRSLSVRFIDRRTGTELGRYAGDRFEGQLSPPGPEK